MSFYDDASWLLIPSGIEEDVVFAQKPTSGLGDLTFTRASDATYTDSTGVVRRSPYNLLLQSNTFSNAAWLTSSASVTSGQSGYDGTLNAWLLTSTSSTNFIYQNNAIDGINTFSIYGKAGTNTQIILYSQHATQGKYFDLSSGTVGANFVAAPISASIENVGGGWYRCSIVVTASANAGWRIYNVAVGTTFIQNAQAVQGTSALDYFPTTNRQDVPRIDFRNADGTLSSCGRLLLEPQRTNSIRNSSMVGAVAGTPGTLPTNWIQILAAGLTRTIVGTGTENGLPYIDVRYNGTATGTSVLLGFETAVGITASNGQVWTGSFYLKTISLPNPPTSFRSLIAEYTSAGVYVRDVGLTITPTSNLNRFSQTETLAGGATTGRVVNGVLGVLTIGAAYDFTIRIAAPQMELGAYATTWVPTTTAAVTRIADAASKTGVSSLIGQTEGTMFLEFDNRLLVSYPNETVIRIDTSSSVNQVFLRKENGSNRYTARLIVGSSTIWTITNINVINGINKIAIGYKTGDSAVFLNGIQSGSTSTASFSGSSFDNLFFNNAGTLNPELALAQAALFPTRLTNAQLAQLTTL